MLKEMGILQDITIVATDLDMNILERAKCATYPIKNMELNEENYIRFYGTAPTLKNYYKEDNGYAVFKGISKNLFFVTSSLILLLKEKVKRSF